MKIFSGPESRATTERGGNILQEVGAIGGRERLRGGHDGSHFTIGQGEWGDMDGGLRKQ